MRLEEFVTVQMRPVSETQVQAIKGKMTIDLDAIGGIAPAVIPSDLTGPSGEPVPKHACVVIFLGGQVTLDVEYDLMVSKVKGFRLVEDE